jgi:ligand-binding sensor domain-containing protein
MRKLLKLTVLPAAILMLIACEKEKNPGKIEYEVNHWPYVKTLEITSVTDTSAILHAVVNAYNLPTIVTFEYGERIPYGKSVIADESPVTGSSLTSVNAYISGLLPYTIYYFRVKAENSVWKNFYGSDSTFVLPVLTDPPHIPDVPVPTCTYYNSENTGLPGNVVRRIFIDGSNNIWIASLFIDYNNWMIGNAPAGTGVTKFDGTNWTTYTTANGLANNMVLSIAIDAQGNIWFGTEGGGVSKFDGINWTTYLNPNGTDYVNPNGSDWNYVLSIAIDDQGNKWFGTRAGVSKFDDTTWTTYTTADGLADNYVHSIVIDNQDIKWIGTHNGISKFDGKNWTNYTKTNSDLVNDDIMAIAIDAQGSKWFGTAWGVSKLDGAEWTTYPYEPSGGQSSKWGQPIFAIAIDALDNKWFGSGEGITKFDGTNWTHYSTANGVKIGSVPSIAIDAEGNKWCATNGIQGSGICVGLLCLQI